MADKKCPKCGLWSAETAKICDCGYLFDEKYKPPPISRNIPSIQRTEQKPYEEIISVRNPSVVSIVNINMPFWSIVGFMIKVSLASIPAIIILGVMGFLFWAIFGGALSLIVNK
jgi:hypothetical protein